MDGKATLRTPLGKVRGLGASGSGTEHFWRQRLTALANVPLAIAFILVVITLVGKDYAQAIQFLSNPLVGVLMFLFLFSGLLHMWLGMQVIIEDYVHGEGTKIAALIVNTGFAILIGACCAYALIDISFATNLIKP
jgi:succinate dehydrogenase / fumarate reductase, membrane anchor subunit